MSPDHSPNLTSLIPDAWFAPFAFALVQLLALAPAAAPSAIYAPRILQAPSGLISLVGLSLFTGVVLTGVLRLVRVTFGQSVRARRMIQTLLVVLVCTSVGASSYYGRFGNYPSTSLVMDFAEAPSAFVAYSGSDVRPGDVILSALGVVSASLLLHLIARRVWLTVPSVRQCAIPIGAGLFAIWSLYSAPVTAQHSYLLAEHSTPTAKYSMNLMRGLARNGVEMFAHALPPRTNLMTGPGKRTRPAKHVLLVIAEALRADRLPAYGYLRPTTPFLTADAQHWITFEHAYSHASRTADSFPVIFNSQYLAAIERTNEGARALWSSLRAADVQTAFVSAAPLEWGALTHAVDYADVDHGWTATNAQSAERVRLTDLSFDYAVDDALPLKTYRELMTTELQHRRSFVTLHLVGSHFPFNYQDTTDTFFPNIKRPEPTMPSAARPLQMYELRSEATQQRLNEIGNSYDNSIRHIDGAVRQAIQVLADLEMLEDSVVILTSDHGESLGEHSTLFHGQTLYEEQVHVPLMMRVGRDLSESAELLANRRHGIAGQIDLMPTVHQLLVPSSPTPSAFQGQSWLQSAGKEYELLLYRGIGEQAAFVTRQQKYIYDSVGRRAEYFDLQLDPREQVNLWPQQTRGSRAAAFLTEIKRQHPTWLR